jgi:glycosyltransferase involved in cell wall biosynthesis
MTAATVSDRASISLIIPAYNEEAYIGTCLEAVARHVQDRVCEVIVVDNASTDRTAEVVAEYPGVVRISAPAKGITKARQAGYRHASGEILAFIDADTIPRAGWIEQIEEQFAARPDLACLSGPYHYHDLPPVRRAIASGWFVAARLVYHLLGYLTVGGNFAIRRSALDAMGGFDSSIEFYGEDVDIGRRARKVGKVLFRRQLVMPTSARRLRDEGQAKIGAIYLLNFLSVAFAGKPVTHNYSDIR